MVFKLADALSRPFRRHFSPSEHSDAKQITPPGNTKHRIALVKAKTFRNLPLHQDPQRKIPRAATFEQRQDIHPWTQDRTLSGTLFRHFKDTPQEMQAQAIFTSAPPKFYSQQKSFATPHPFTTFNRSFSPPRTCSLCKQRWFFTQPQPKHIS